MRPGASLVPRTAPGTHRCSKLRNPECSEGARGALFAGGVGGVVAEDQVAGTAHPKAWRLRPSYPPPQAHQLGSLGGVSGPGGEMPRGTGTEGPGGPGDSAADQPAPDLEGL